MAYENKTLDIVSVCMDGVLPDAVSDELQDEDRDAGPLYYGHQREQGIGSDLAGAVCGCL